MVFQRLRPGVLLAAGALVVALQAWQGKAFAQG